MSLNTKTRWVVPAFLATGLLLCSSARAAEAIAGFVDSTGRVVFVNEPTASPAKPVLSASKASAARKVIAKASASPKVLVNSENFAYGMIGAAAPVPAEPAAPTEASETTDPTPEALSVNSSREDIHELINEVAQRHQVDADLVHAIVRVESNYNPFAISNKGARGLMQLIPATARRFGVSNSFDPRDNLDGGIRYLKYLMGMFNGDLRLSLAAYNAGEMAVTRNGGIPPYRETQDYVRKITALYPTRTVAAAAGVPVEPRIVRYVDDSGVVHFSNTDLQ
jgi:soluble lytic murein transglycosylase-like protein